jgi:hypothetical protein
MGNASSDAAQLLCIAVCCCFPIAGLRIWHYEAAVVDAYFIKLAKQREDDARELAAEVEERRGIRYEEPYIDYLYSDIGDCITAMDPEAVC